jgi:hypothetical protein
MPTYFFHVLAGENFLEDDEGQDLPDNPRRAAQASNVSPFINIILATGTFRGRDWTKQSTRREFCHGGNIFG